MWLTALGLRRTLLPTSPPTFLLSSSVSCPLLSLSLQTRGLVYQLHSENRDAASARRSLKMAPFFPWIYPSLLFSSLFIFHELVPSAALRNYPENEGECKRGFSSIGSGMKRWGFAVCGRWWAAAPVPLVVDGTESQPLSALSVWSLWIIHKGRPERVREIEVKKTVHRFFVFKHIDIKFVCFNHAVSIVSRVAYTVAYGIITVTA